MMLSELVSIAANKSKFESLSSYFDFCQRFLEFVDGDGLQAIIVSQNEREYRFYQFKEDGHYNVSRPINSQLLLSSRDAASLASQLPEVLEAAHSSETLDESSRALIRCGIYTLQQAIGVTLDALPSGSSNTARKINGDLFERLIRMLISSLGVDCTAGTVNVPVVVDGQEQFRMSYQHDLIIRQDSELKAIGGVKTSSKDRIDKIFVDKFLYSRITDTQIPHIAIFLNDVQRKRGRQPGRYGVSATFLPGHFKGYTVKLNPLDGVYYCDIRPNMRTDSLLAAHIKTIDHFFCTDLWQFVRRPGDRISEVAPDASEGAQS